MYANYVLQVPPYSAVQSSSYISSSCSISCQVTLQYSSIFYLIRVRVCVYLYVWLDCYRILRILLLFWMHLYIHALYKPSSQTSNPFFTFFKPKILHSSCKIQSPFISFFFMKYLFCCTKLFQTVLYAYGRLHILQH